MGWRSSGDLTFVCFSRKGEEDLFSEKELPTTTQLHKRKKNFAIIIPITISVP